MPPAKRDPKPARPSFLQVHFNALLNGILAGAALLYALLNPRFQTGVFNDDAIYVLGARSLWNTAGFQSALLRPDYPLPGVPLLLAPWIKLVKSDWTGLEWIAIFTMLLAVLLFGRWARRWLPPGQALAAAALLAFNPLIAKYSGIIMPGTFYMLGVIAGFSLMTAFIEKPSPALAAGLGLVLGWAALVRPEGCILLVIVAAALAFTRTERKYLPWMAGPVVLWGIFLSYWWDLFKASTTEYGSDVTALLAYWPHHTVDGLLFAGRLFHAFLFQPLTGILFPSPGLPYVFLGLGMALLAGLLTLGFRRLWKDSATHRPVLVSGVLFCAAYSSVHLIWHVAQTRYAVPLLPWIILALVRGAPEALSRVQHRKLVAQGALVLMLLCYAVRDGRELRESLWLPDPMKSPPWRTLAWVNRHTGSDTQVLSDIAPSIELYSNRPAGAGKTATNVEIFISQLARDHFVYIVDRDVSFLTPEVGGVENPNLIWSQRRIWIAHYPQRFQLVFHDLEERTRIYQINADPGLIPAYEKFAQALRAYEAGELQAALNILHECVRLCPSLGSAKNLLGAVYLRQNDLVAAEKAFKESVVLRPDFPDALVNLATVYRMAGQAGRAEEYIQKALLVSQENGNLPTFQTKIHELYQMWDRNRALIFMDAPAAL